MLMKVVFGEGGVINEIDLMSTTTHGYIFHNEFEFKKVMWGCQGWFVLNSFGVEKYVAVGGGDEESSWYT